MESGPPLFCERPGGRRYLKRTSIAGERWRLVCCGLRWRTKYEKPKSNITLTPALAYGHGLDLR